MEKRNNSNTKTTRVSTTIKEEAEAFVGEPPKPYTSMTKLHDEALRAKITILEKRYPQFKKQIKEKSK